MDKIILLRPIWGGGFRDKGTEKFGIAEYRMRSEILEVECVYENRFKNRVFPSIYRISRALAMTFPRQLTKGTWLRVIPITAFEEVVKV